MNQIRERAQSTWEHLSFGWRGLSHKAAAPLVVENGEHDDDDSDSSFPLFVWGAVTALVLWWMYLRPGLPKRAPAGKLNRLRANRRPGPRPGSRPASAAPQQSRAQATTPLPEAEAAPPDDDLTRIYGIGPVRAARLREAGIATFEALAVADTEQLREILAGVGVETADMSSWPEQASLAARGDWEAFDTLQSRLRQDRA